MHGVPPAQADTELWFRRLGFLTWAEKCVRASPTSPALVLLPWDSSNSCTTSPPQDTFWSAMRQYVGKQLKSSTSVTVVGVPFFDFIIKAQNDLKYPKVFALYTRAPDLTSYTVELAKKSTSWKSSTLRLFDEALLISLTFCFSSLIIISPDNLVEFRI